MKVTNKEPDALIASILIAKIKSKNEPKKLIEYAPIALSAFIHVAIFGYLSHQSFKAPAPLTKHKKVKVKPINSFLYRLSDYKKLKASKATQLINAKNISNAHTSNKQTGSQVDKNKGTAQQQAIIQKSNIKTKTSELNNIKEPILPIAKKDPTKNNKN